MIKQLLIGLFLLSSLAVATAGARGDTGSDSARRRFLAEYPEASKRLENFYIKIIINFTRKDGRGNYEEYEFSQTGGPPRLVRLVSNRDEPSYASVADPALSFRLKQDSKSSRYSVINMDSHDPDSYQLRGKLIRATALPAFAPYAYYSRSIRDMVFGKSTRIEGVQESDGS